MKSNPPGDAAVDFVAEHMSGAGDARVIDAIVADLARVAPSASLRDRILAASAGPGRLYRFAEQIAAMVDVTIDKARELLDRVAESTLWERNLFPGMDALWVEGGPAVANCIRGFARLEAGAAFPEHEHLGDETTLVLEGVMLESGGAVVRPGEQIVMTAATHHHYRAAPGRTDLLFFLVVREGIGLPGAKLLHRDG